MPLPEGYLPREGDVLVLHGTVKYDVAPDEKRVHIKLDGDHGPRVLLLETIIGIRRRTWKEDEKVRHRNLTGVFGHVVAMAGDRVWIKLAPKSAQRRSHGGFMTVHCNEIEIDPIATGLQPLRDAEDNPVTTAIAEGRAPTLDEVSAVVEPHSDFADNPGLLSPALQETNGDDDVPI
jgi:hypothetical protein